MIHSSIDKTFIHPLSHLSIHLRVDQILTILSKAVKLLATAEAKEKPGVMVSAAATAETKKPEAMVSSAAAATADTAETKEEPEAMVSSVADAVSRTVSSTAAATWPST